MILANSKQNQTMPNKLDMNWYQQYINIITNLKSESPLYHYNMVLMALCPSGIIPVPILAILRKTLWPSNKCWSSHHLVETIFHFLTWQLKTARSPTLTVTFDIQPGANVIRLFLSVIYNLRLGWKKPDRENQECLAERKAQYGWLPCAKQYRSAAVLCWKYYLLLIQNKTH